MTAKDRILSDAIQTSIDLEKKNIRLVRISTWLGILCVFLLGVILTLVM